MEHTTEGGQTHTRHDFNANITQQDLVDSYLAPFQSCVEKAQVSSLMCSYNAINGVPRWVCGLCLGRPHVALFADVASSSIQLTWLGLT